MPKLDNRSVLFSVATALLGASLLLLVSPSLSDHLPTPVVATLAVVLLAASAVFTYAFSSGKLKKLFKPLRRNTKTSIARSAVASIVFSAAFTYASGLQPAYAANTQRYIFENIGIALLFVAFACIILLINSQKFVYSPFWNAQDKLSADERQKNVRNRVFEKSYRIMIAILITAGIVAGSTSSQRVDHEIVQILALCLFGLPAIIAAHQKDS